MLVPQSGLFWVPEADRLDSDRTLRYRIDIVFGAADITSTTGKM
jgi:hypothetical protein